MMKHEEIIIGKEYYLRADIHNKNGIVDENGIEYCGEIGNSVVKKPVLSKTEHGNVKVMLDDGTYIYPSANVLFNTVSDLIAYHVERVLQEMIYNIDIIKSEDTEGPENREAYCLFANGMDVPRLVMAYLQSTGRYPDLSVFSVSV